MLALIEIELRFEPSMVVIRFILGSPSRIVEKCAQIIIAAEVFWPFFPAFTVLPFGIIRSFSFGGWCPFADCVKRKIANEPDEEFFGGAVRVHFCPEASASSVLCKNSIKPVNEFEIVPCQKL